jgi:beta-glucosidase/6-phospho-beta-glucosidase/beta-galactosidase
LLFRSFFWAGFECATGFNSGNEWIDQVEATAHDRFADRDYAAAAAAGLLTAREGIRWPIVDTPSGYDFESVLPFLKAAERHGIQPVWDLFHYGFPEGLDIFSDEFVERFAAYCHETARFLAENAPGPHFITPVNEPSYFAWAGGEAAKFAPYQQGRAYEMKIQLCRAAIKGAEAIWSVIPEARMVQADPICRQVAPRDRPDLEEEANRFNESVVFESLDFISGRKLPELGGSARHLDIVGINYYWNNQWEVGQPEAWLDADDDRRCTIGDIIRDVWQRYGHPIVLTETGHVDEHRGSWLREVSGDVQAVIAEGVLVEGICLYPILGMPEWHERGTWSRMGLWDIDCGSMRRRLYKPLYDVLREAQERLPSQPQRRARRLAPVP